MPNSAVAVCRIGVRQPPRIYLEQITAAPGLLAQRSQLACGRHRPAVFGYRRAGGLGQILWPGDRLGDVGLFCGLCLRNLQLPGHHPQSRSHPGFCGHGIHCLCPAPAACPVAKRLVLGRPALYQWRVHRGSLHCGGELAQCGGHQRAAWQGFCGLHGGQQCLAGTGAMVDSGR